MVNTKDQVKKISSTPWIKIAVSGILLILVHVLFGMLLNRAWREYELLFFPGLKIFALIFWIFFDLFLVTIFAGIFGALVRPTWIIILGFFVSSIVMFFAWGIDIFSAVSSIIYFFITIFYSLFVVRELNNRIRFSVRPMSEGQRSLLFGLILLISISFAFGYLDDSKKRNFVIPPKYKEMILNVVLPQLTGGLTSQIEGQIGGQLNELTSQVPPELQGELEEQGMSEGIEGLLPFDDLGKEVEKLWVDAESFLKPFRQLIALGFGLLTFLVLETTMALISWIIPLVLMIIFPILKVFGMAKEFKKMEEIKKLVL